MTDKTPEAVVERVARWVVHLQGRNWGDLNDLGRDSAFSDARQIISAHLEALKAEGWILVPKEPTEAMSRAGLDSLCKDYDFRADNEISDYEVAVSYRAMIAAAEEKA